MNSTFMFGEDRFGEGEDFFRYCKSIGGDFLPGYVNKLIRQVYNYLDKKYSAEEYRHCFPSLEEAIDVCSNHKVYQPEKEKVIDTFSYHEHGTILENYVQSLRNLSKQFTMSLVVDIWAPKRMWANTFREL